MAAEDAGGVFGREEDPCLCWDEVSKLQLKRPAELSSRHILSIRFVKYEMSVSSSPLKFGSGSLPCHRRSGMGLSMKCAKNLLISDGPSSATERFMKRNVGKPVSGPRQPRETGHVCSRQSEAFVSWTDGANLGVRPFVLAE